MGQVALLLVLNHLIWKRKRKYIITWNYLQPPPLLPLPVCSWWLVADRMYLWKKRFAEKRGDISWESGYTLYSPSMRSEISSYIWNNFGEGSQDLSRVQQRSKCCTPQHLQTVCPNYLSSVPGHPRWSHSAVRTQLLDYQRFRQGSINSI